MVYSYCFHQTEVGDSLIDARGCCSVLSAATLASFQEIPVERHFAYK